jgi:hypothetical protein
MSITLSQGLPANVVEIGNEVTQAKIDEINSGTLALQTWVSLGFAPKASPTFTGVVTIPAGASISGYLTTATASSTYQTQAGMSSYLTTATASSTYAPKASPTFTGVVTIPAGASISGYLTTATASSTYQPIGSYLTDAPSDGSEYVRKNAAWAVVTGGGGISDAPSNGNLYARQNAAWTAFSVTPSVTNIDLTGNFNGYSMGSGNYTFKFDSSANTLRMQDGAGSGITISPTGITFPNSSVLTTSPAKSVNTLSGSYTLAATDKDNIVYVPTGAGGGFGLTISFPDDGTYNFPVGTVIMLCVDNTVSGTNISFSTTSMGSPTVVGSLFSAGIGSSTSGQWFMTKLAANLWILS